MSQLALETPESTQVRVDRWADGKTEALVMITTRKPDGSPLGRRAARTTVMYSVR